MNFLLHLIGRTHRDAILRPTPRQALLLSACRNALAGDFHAAVTNTAKLARMPGGLNAAETLVRAHLHLAAHDYLDAAHHFSAAIGRLNTPSDAHNSCVSEFSQMLTTTTDGHPATDGASSKLERLIDSADAHLRQGRYVRAIDLFQQARTLLDTLLAAHAGMIVADARAHETQTPDSAKPLLALVNLGDLLLRMLARTHLASNVAAGLRQRALRDDLAPWATTGNDVNELLRSELALLVESTRQNPHHAELHYRLGLVARALGERPTAERAFQGVLQLHPHHVLSAARLAATLLQTNKPEAAMPLLAVAFAIPAPTLQNYEKLASTMTDSPSFDRAVTRLCHDLGADRNPAAIRANLAFALGELGLLDDHHAAWRESAPAA